MKILLISLLPLLLALAAPVASRGPFWNNGPPRPPRSHPRPPRGHPPMKPHHQNHHQMAPQQHHLPGPVRLNGPFPSSGPANLQGSGSALHQNVVPPSGPNRPPHHHQQNHHGPPQHHHGPPHHQQQHRRPPPPPPHGHHHGPKPNFPPPRFMKPSGSHPSRQRVRPPPPKSQRPPMFFKQPPPHHHMKPLNPVGPSGPPPLTGSGPTSGFFTGPPQEFRQSEMPFETTRLPVTEGPSIHPSKQYPMDFSMPQFSGSNNDIENLPPAESISLITSFPFLNGTEHGWTAPNYKGWIPVARPASYYLEREKSKNHHHSHQQHEAQQSQHVTAQQYPQSTTEVYRDHGGKHHHIMMNTMFRDNVTNFRPMKPEYSEDHKSVVIPLPDEDGQRIRIPASIFFDDFGREPSNFNEIISSGGPPRNHQNNHNQAPVSMSWSNQEIHMFPPQSNNNFEGHQHHKDRDTNPLPSHSEEAPVRKPFPKFKATFTPPSNESSVISESLANAGQLGTSSSSSESERPNLVHKYKKRPQFQRVRKPTTPSAEESDEQGPPKVGSQLTLKEKITRGRIRIRGQRRPIQEASSSSESGSDPAQKPQEQQQESTASGEAQSGGPHRQQQMEDNLNNPPGPSYSTISGPSSSEVQHSGPQQHLPPPPPPPPQHHQQQQQPQSPQGPVLVNNGTNFNFPAPPSLYGGGYYGQGHPMAPPPAFFDPVSPPFFPQHSGPEGPGQFQGNPTLVSNNNNNNNGPNHEGPRAGPTKHPKKKVRPEHIDPPKKHHIHNNNNADPTTTTLRSPPAQEQTGFLNPQQGPHQGPPHGPPHGPPQGHSQGPPQGPPQGHPQGPPQHGNFYFPNEFNQLSGNDGHPSISFMSMPGSQPNVIRHQFDTLPQGPQGPQGPQQQYPVNIIGPAPQQPPQQQFRPHPPPPHHQHHHHHHHHHPQQQFHHTGPSRPGPTGPVPSPNMPHHIRQRPESTTIRGPPLHHQHNQFNFVTGSNEPPRPSHHPPLRQDLRNVRHHHGPRPPMPLPAPPPTGASPTAPQRPLATNFRPGITVPPPNNFESQEFERIPFEFASQLRPILVDGHNNNHHHHHHIEGPTAPSNFHSTTLRPSPQQGNNNNHDNRHVHQSPDIMPPTGFFDDFMKPFDNPPPPPTTTERQPIYPPPSGGAASFSSPQFIIPAPQNNKFYDSHKSPSVNFAQFLRPQQEEYPPATYITNSIVSDQQFHIAPIQDFTSISSPAPSSPSAPDTSKFSPSPPLPQRPQFSKPRPSRPSFESTSSSSEHTTPSAFSSSAPQTPPTDPDIVAPEVDITEAPKRGYTEIRATHRPIYYRKRTETLPPSISSTTYKPTTAAFTASNTDETESHQQGTGTTGAETTFSQEPISETHHHHSFESTHQNHQHYTPAVSVEQTDIVKTKSSEVTNPAQVTYSTENHSSDSGDEVNQDESSIPTRHTRPLTTITTTTFETTTPEPTSEHHEEQTQPTTFSPPKRYLKRRRPGFNEAATSAGRKKFFSAKLNRTSSSESTSSVEDHGFNRFHQKPTSAPTHETPEPPITTHRPFRRHRPVSSTASATEAADMVVTAPHTYTRHRVFSSQRQKAQRQGVHQTAEHLEPASSELSPVHRPFASSSVEQRPIKFIKRRKSTTTTTPSASSEDHTSSPNGVTYGESQWFRLNKPTTEPAPYENGDENTSASRSPIAHTRSGLYPKYIVSMSKSSSSSSSSSAGGSGGSKKSETSSDPFEVNPPSIIGSMENSPSFSPRKKYSPFHKKSHVPKSLIAQPPQFEPLPQPATLVQLQAPRSINFNDLVVPAEATSSETPDSQVAPQASSSESSSNSSAAAATTSTEVRQSEEEPPAAAAAAPSMSSESSAEPAASGAVDDETSSSTP